MSDVTVSVTESSIQAFLFFSFGGNDMLNNVRLYLCCLFVPVKLYILLFVDEIAVGILPIRNTLHIYKC